MLLVIWLIKRVPGDLVPFSFWLCQVLQLFEGNSGSRVSEAASLIHHFICALGDIISVLLMIATGGSFSISESPVSHSFYFNIIYNFLEMLKCIM